MTSRQVVTSAAGDTIPRVLGISGCRRTVLQRAALTSLRPFVGGVSSSLRLSCVHERKRGNLHPEISKHQKLRRCHFDPQKTYLKHQTLVSVWLPTDEKKASRPPWGVDLIGKVHSLPSMARKKVDGSISIHPETLQTSQKSPKSPRIWIRIRFHFGKTQWIFESFKTEILVTWRLKCSTWKSCKSSKWTSIYQLWKVQHFTI